MDLWAFLRRRRWIIYLIVLFLFLSFIRSFFTRSFSVAKKTPPPPGDEGAWMDPLPVPFYPTFKDIHLLKDRAALETYLYAVDETAYMPDEYMDMEKLLRLNLSAPENSRAEGPRILIFHTHSQEAYADSRPGETADTVVGMGAELARVLVEDYGISVVHDVGNYDTQGGDEYREGSYERMEPSVKKWLDKYPSIEVTIDLHRDGVPEDKRLLLNIGGKPTARIMFFNGISYLNENGTHSAVDTLPNPYIKENLAFSLRMHLTANELYPGLARRIYIRPYRYSLHFKPMSALVELGANTNTVQEALNAVKPLAEILTSVI